MRQFAATPRKAQAPTSGAVVAAGLAHQRSAAKIAMPSALHGTSFAVMRPRSRRPQSSEPIPTPIEFTARNKVTTWLSAVR